MTEALHICTCAPSVGTGPGISDRLALGLGWERSRCPMLTPEHSSEAGGHRTWVGGGKSDLELLQSFSGTISYCWFRSDSPLFNMMILR